MTNSYNVLLHKMEASYSELHAEGKKPYSLYEPIVYTLSSGGKRVRPVLALMAASLYSARIENALPVAHALETFHNFTLLHDDIMDNSPTRRGNPSVQVKYGVSQAILSGDAMFAIAINSLAQADEKKMPYLLKAFSKMALDIMKGQQMDMDFEKESAISLSDYFTMIRLKTAVLFSAALELGAYAAGASEEDCHAIAESGIAIGIAFQLRDDYLDVYGDDKTLGKPIGGDIEENKKTWLSIRAHELATERGDDTYSKMLSLTDPVEKYNAVRSYYDKCGLPEEGEQYIREYTQKALAELDKLHPSCTEAKESLREIYLLLAGRKL